MTSPKRSSADSDSDSTSTELCDEPDRLSDVDSEEPTSTSDCYVMATDDERSPSLGNSPIAGQTPARMQPEVRNEFASVRVVDAIPEPLKQVSEYADLEDTSIAEITDQIRRLSAGDNDLFVSKVPCDPEIDKTLPEDSTRLIFEETKNSFDSLDTYNFLGNSSRVGHINFGSNLNKANILMEKGYRRMEIKESPDDSKVKLEHSDMFGENDSIVAVDAEKNGVDRTFSDFSYDYKNHFDSSLGVSSQLEPCHVSNSNGESTLSSDVSGRIYPRNYVIGHLPISLGTGDQKVGKLSFDTRQAKNLESNIDQLKDSNGWSASFDYTYKTKTSIEANSPKSPESFSSGETMGPDSKPSSLTVSPRTPLRSESRDLTLEKSNSSSVSSDSRTLTLQTVEADMAFEGAKLESKIPSFDKSCPSTPISIDSLKAKSDCSPKLMVSSSSESYSPSKLKSSERSFSSDLQSPISANSIKYTSNLNDNGHLSETPPIELTSITSPFYPIAHPNQKTPSPYDAAMKLKTGSTDVSPHHRYSTPKDFPTSDYLPSVDSFSENKSKPLKNVSSEYKSYESNSEYKYHFDLDSKISGSAFHSYQRNHFDEDQFQDTEKDSLPPLPRENPSNRFSTLNENSFGANRSENNFLGKTELAKPFERSCSSLDKKFPDMTSSSSIDEITSSVKKRSSDILEDLKHLETNTDGLSDTNMLTKKTGYIWEDVENLKARRQDTFSDSATGFSKRQLEIPGISISNENRKTYIVEPKIHIHENSDSILKKVTQNSNNSYSNDDRESKLGVWTKVKPRKIGDNGRRSSSDRALKIIQENSVILQKILTCQAKKRLPDLEEISKEITISPINEEISKIFSPILEKMGLNEHEINEELSRINFKDLDHMTTSTSEFDAKINDELCKLSLIGDDEEVDPVDIDEISSENYLETRDAFIDRQINEELSKLLLNYEGNPPNSDSVFKRDPLDQNGSLNLYKSIEENNGALPAQKEILHSEKYIPYNDSVLPSLTQDYNSIQSYNTTQTYAIPTKYNHPNFTSKSDMDIYRELEKLDQISSGHVLTSSSKEIPGGIISSVPYTPQTSPFSELRTCNLDYPIQAEKPFDTSPQKSPYDTYKPYDYKSRMSPRKTLNNPYSVRGYEKSYADSTFNFSNQRAFEFDLSHKKVLSKETLEFRVHYDEDHSKLSREVDLSLSPCQTDLADLDKSTSYYNNKPITPTNNIGQMKYTANDERFATSNPLSSLLYKYDVSDSYPYRKYESISPINYGSSRTDFDRQPYKVMGLEPETEVGSYLTTGQVRESHELSSSNQFENQEFAQSTNPFLTKLAPSLDEASKRPVSHPEFPDKLNLTKYCDLPSREAINQRKSSLSLGNIGHVNRPAGMGFDTTTNPKLNFSPFPIRNLPMKPKELGLKLGLYSPTSPGNSQGKKS